jgi:hypothetical protein
MHPVMVIAMAGMIFVGGQAFAGNALSQAAMNRRQLINCMNKTMSSNKAISYNEATKVCKDQLKAQNGRVAFSTPTTQANAH